MDKHNQENNDTEEILSSIETNEEKLPSIAAVTHEKIRYEGIKALERDTWSLIFSAIAAGLSMGTSMFTKAIFEAYLPNSEVSFIIANLGYTIGFVIVILAQQQLFTENTVTAVLPFMSNPNLTNFGLLIRMWGLVLIGNLIGTTIFAWILLHLPVFPMPVVAYFPKLGHEIMENTPWEMFTKGIFAGWLIATLVWMLPHMENNKLSLIIIITYIIAIGGFTHIIVGSVEILYLVFKGELSFGSYLYPFGLPTLAGNIVGGTFIFALISHAQIRSDMPGKAFK